MLILLDFSFIDSTVHMLHISELAGLKEVVLKWILSFLLDISQKVKKAPFSFHLFIWLSQRPPYHPQHSKTDVLYRCNTT